MENNIISQSHPLFMSFLSIYLYISYQKYRRKDTIVLHNLYRLFALSLDTQSAISCRMIYFEGYD